MRLYTLACALLSGVLLPSFPSANAAATSVKAVFLFKDVMQSNTTALQTSGFNTLIIFRIGVLASGDLVYYSTGVKGEAVDAPGLLDRAYLQVYDGGAGNNPGTWQAALGMKVVPIVWVTNDAKPSQGNTAAQAQAKFAGCYSQYAAAGGGYWNDYDIEKMGSSYTSYGAVLTSVFQ